MTPKSKNYKHTKIISNMLIPCKSLHIGKGGQMVHNIKQMCKEKHLTLAEVERRADVSFINRWDRNEPSVYKVLRVARVLDTTVEELCAER